MRLISVLAIALFSAASLHSQDRLVVFPPSGSEGAALSLFAPASLSHSWTLPGASRVLISPDGSRMYVVSNSAGEAFLTVATPTGEILSAPRWINAEARDMRVTPDGKHLLILSGNGLFVRDTADLFGSSTTFFHTGPTPVAIEVSNDSRIAYILDPANKRLIAEDITCMCVTSGIEIPGTASSIAAGPNGMIYVAAAGQVMELAPKNQRGELVVRRTIKLPGGFMPKQPEFSPDGRMLLVLNSAPSGAPGAFYDLESGVLKLLWEFGPRFNEILAPSSEYALAVAADGMLYSIPFLTLEPAGPLFGLRAVRSIVISAEAPRARSVFALTGDPDAPATLTRVDLDTFEREDVAVGTAARLLYLGTAGSTASMVLQSSGVVTVSPGEPLPPLIVRAVDADGRPVIGAPVTWSAPSGFTSNYPAMAETNAAGYAEAGYSAPYVFGTYQLTATVGTIRTDFALIVSFPPALNDGLEDTARSVSILSGQGLVTWEGRIPSEPLMIQAFQKDGSPLSGAQVLWSVEALEERPGLAALEAPPCGDRDGVRTCISDSEGKSSVRFRPIEVPYGKAFSLMKVTAQVVHNGETVGASEFYVAMLPVGGVLNYELVEPAAGTVLNLLRGQPISYPIAVRVWTADNEALSNVRVNISAADQTLNAHCLGGMQLTDTAGNAACALVGSGSLGSSALIIDIGGVHYIQDVLSATVVAGPPARIVKLDGDGQSGKPGDELPTPLVASIRDGAGFALPGTPVSWEVVRGSALLSSWRSVANAAGDVSAVVTFGATPGPVVVRVRAQNAWADFTLSNEPIAAVEVASGDGQSVPPNRVFKPLVVRVLGAQGPLPNVPVTFAVTKGSAALWTPEVKTGADGTASAILTARAALGEVTVTATAAGETAEFSLAVTEAGAVLDADGFVNAASFEPGVSPGGLVSVFTNGLLVAAPQLSVGSCLTAEPVEGQFPLNLGGVEVAFADTRAPLLAFCRTAQEQHQINLQTPFDLTPGTFDVTVRAGSGSTPPVAAVATGVQVAKAAPGVFQMFAEGRLIAIAIRPDGSLVTPSNPALRGETVFVYATGLGPLIDGAGDEVQRPAYTPVVELAGIGASGVTAQYLSDSIGLFVVSLAIPEDVQAGEAELRLNILTDADELIRGAAARLPVE